MPVDIGLVFNTVFSLFIIMIIGIIARLTGVIDWKATRKLSSFLINITQPLLIIISFQTEVSADKLKIGGTILAASIIIHVGFSVLARLFNRHTEKEKKSTMEFGLIFANCAFIGYPVLASIFGSDGYFYGAVFSLVFNIYIRTYGIFILSKNKKGSAAVKEALLNPGTIASVAGILLFVFSIKLPTVLHTSFELLGNITFPLSMIIVGSLLCNQPFKKIFKLDILIFSFIKLIIFPLLTLAICLLFNVNSGLTYICVAMASMPTAANTAIFSDYYGADGPLAAGCVGVSSLLSVGSIPLMLFLTGLLLDLLGRV